MRHPLHEPLGVQGLAAPEARWWFHRRGRQRGTGRRAARTRYSAGMNPKGRPERSRPCVGALGGRTTTACELRLVPEPLWTMQGVAHGAEVP